MSGKLRTNNIKTGGMPKVIEPGHHVVKLNGLSLSRFSFMEEEQGYYLVMDVETKPIEGFEGFFIDKDDESKGRHLGQVGQVKTNRFYYRDGTTKTGVKISRDTEILKQIKVLCKLTGNGAWFDKSDDKYETIEDFVQGFNDTGILPDQYINMCVGGKEFERKTGYKGYDMFLPKMKKGEIAMEAADASPSKLMAFNADDHIIKMDNAPAGDFKAPAADDLPGGDLPADDLPAGNADLAGAPEFDL